MDTFNFIQNNVTNLELNSTKNFFERIYTCNENYTQTILVKC